MPINGDPFKPVASGDDVAPRLNTAWFNAVTETADARKRQRPRPPQGSGFTARIPEGLILVRNNSGADRARFEVMGIDQILFSPTQNQDEFQNNPALSCVAPSVAQHKGKFVICLDAIPNGEIGRAFVFGTCPVQINMISASDAFADVSDADPTQLLSSSAGAVRILWVNAGTGTQWALVRFSGSGTSLPDPTARYQVLTPIDDTLKPIWTTLRFEL